MRQVTQSRTIAARALLPAALILTSLTMALPAVAEPEAADGRYEAYVEQEVAQERTRQDEGAGSQTATTDVGGSDGIVTYSQLPNSPYAFGNAAQHQFGR